MTGTEIGPTKEHPAPTRRRDNGSTFVEIVITITLAGIVLVALLAAVRTSITASSTIYESAQVETVLLNAADYVHRAKIHDCDYDNEVNAATPDDWTINVVVENLVAAPTGNPTTDWGPCSVPVSAFDVQRLTITATDPGAAVTRTITVVRSSVD